MDDAQKSKEFVINGGWSLYKISKETGIPSNSLSRLKHGTIDPYNMAYRSIMKLSKLYDENKRGSVKN